MKQRQINKLSILLLCDNNPGHANTILDHINALVNKSQHDVNVFNTRWISKSILFSLDAFDVIVIHYSLVVISDYYLAQNFRDKIRQFQGLKVMFIQDDYRWVDEIAAMIMYLGIDILFTLVPTIEIPKIWDDKRLPGVVKLNTLAGYVPEKWLSHKAPPIADRPIDVGYRGRILPFWLGSLSQEKVAIAKGFLKHASRFRLNCDIKWQEEDRIYGNDWIDFLCSCKAVLGTESGSSITDFDGSIEKRVVQYLEKHPGADFNSVHQKILLPYEDNVRMNIISPRIFEAVSLRISLILFPGEYSGIIRPWDHYIPLEKDFSNINEVVEKLRDVEFLYRLTDRAYKDIIDSGKYSFDVMVQEFDHAVNKHIRNIQAKRHILLFRMAKFENKIIQYLIWTAIRPSNFITKYSIQLPVIFVRKTYYLFRYGVLRAHHYSLVCIITVLKLILSENTYERIRNYYRGVRGR